MFLPMCFGAREIAKKQSVQSISGHLVILYNMYSDSSTDQLDGSAKHISWTKTARWISFLFIRLWPVCIFKVGPFSLYIVMASEYKK